MRNGESRYGRVLVVDNDPDALENIRKLLQTEGYEVLAASTGEEGVLKVETEHPEVVLMDMSLDMCLPVTGGNETLRKIKQIQPSPAVIMLAAYPTVDGAIEALKQGASDFIKKPFENDYLLHIVHQSIANFRTLREKERLEEEVRRLSITDDLTGLYNYRHFYKTLESELARLKRQKTSLCLMMVDIDNFKRYNDRFGHLEGDKALKKIGEILNRSIRSNVDSGYRYGGDEFAILLIGASIDQGRVIGERIRASIEEAGFLHITASIGLAEFQDRFTLESFVKSADDAAYTAKQSGGNRVYPHRS